MPLGDGPFYAIEDIVIDGVLAYAIGQEVPLEIAEEHEDSVIEDPAPLLPVSSPPSQIVETTTGLVVGDTLAGRVKLKEGDAA